MLDSFFSTIDAARATRALQKLAQHDVFSWVLTGGLATEIHLGLRGAGFIERQLNDIDFIVDRFERIPSSLARDYWFRHVHPSDPSGKTILQAIDPEEALRIDVFRACHGSIDRAALFDLAGITLRLISIDDLTARTARLVLDLAGNIPVPAKHARDFLRLLPFADPDAVESVWQEHRKPTQPPKFSEVAGQLEKLIPLRRDLLIVPDYSTDVNLPCPRCAPTAAFELASAQSMIALLGYC